MGARPPAGGRFLRLLQILIAHERSQLHLATSQQAKQQEDDGLMPRQARLRLRASTELLVDPLERVRRSQRFPLRRGKAQESEELVAGFLQAYAAKFELPVALNVPGIDPEYNQLLKMLEREQLIGQGRTRIGDREAGA